MSTKKSSTRPELDLEAILKELGIKYEVQYQIGDLTRPDFVVLPNTAIYVDGNYWHGTKEADERDTCITKELTKQGWKVMRFSEHQVMVTPTLVKFALLDLRK